MLRKVLFLNLRLAHLFWLEAITWMLNGPMLGHNISIVSTTELSLKKLTSVPDGIVIQRQVQENYQDRE